MRGRRTAATTQPRAPAGGLGGLGAVALLAVLGACGGRGGPETPAPAAACVPASGSLFPGASLAGEAGSYALVLTSDDGRSTSGSLTLREQPEELRVLADVVTPLGGTADVDLEAVGAWSQGGLDSADPAAPGVLVLEGEDDGRPSVLLRLGSSANRRDVLSFDGAYMVLSVASIDESGFRGRWRSGVGTRRTEGYFCAWAEAR